MINILHCSPWPLGGATSYVVHLAATFRAANVPFRVVRISKRTEPRVRTIGQYGVTYRNMSVESAMALDGKFFLASAPTDEAIAQGAVQLVENSFGGYAFHDPNEFGMYPHWDILKKLYPVVASRIVCIREAGMTHVPMDVPYGFIPHPYVRFFNKGAHSTPKSQLAVSVARTSPVKKSDWILEVNQSLPKPARVELRGEVNRMWWNFNVKKKFPGLEPPANAGFPREWGAAAKICAPYRFMVDLTIFKDDGGGTQYSFLEAMDAGAVPVMTADWASYPGVARDFGFQVANADELYDLLLRAYSGDEKVLKKSEKLRAANYTYLDRVHNPKAVAAAYIKLLGLKQ